MILHLGKEQGRTMISILKTKVALQQSNKAKGAPEKYEHGLLSCTLLSLCVELLNCFIVALGPVELLELLYSRIRPNRIAPHLPLPLQTVCRICPGSLTIIFAVISAQSDILQFDAVQPAVNCQARHFVSVMMSYQVISTTKPRTQA